MTELSPWRTRAPRNGPAERPGTGMREADTSVTGSGAELTTYAVASTERSGEVRPLSTAKPGCAPAVTVLSGPPAFPDPQAATVSNTKAKASPEANLLTLLRQVI